MFLLLIDVGKIWVGTISFKLEIILTAVMQLEKVTIHPEIMLLSNSISSLDYRSIKADAQMPITKNIERRESPSELKISFF